MVPSAADDTQAASEEATGAQHLPQSQLILHGARGSNKLLSAT